MPSTTDARTLAEALDGADVFLGLSAAGALKPEMVKKMAPAADHLRDGQSRSRNHPARRQGGAARRDHRHRPFGLSEPGQQRARLPLHLPRRARRARDRDQRGDEDRRRRGASPNWRASRCPRKSPRPMACSHSFGPDYIIPAPFDPRLMEVVPAAVAKAAMDIGRRAASRSSTWTPIASSCARGSTRPPRCSPRPMKARARNPKRVRLRRGRGGSGAARRDRVPRRRLWHAGAGRPRRRARPAARARRRRSRELSSSTTAAIRRWCPRWSTSSTSGSSGAAICAATCERMVNQDRNIFGALLLAARRGRRDDHRHHPHLCADDARGAPRDRSRAAGAPPFGIQ